MCSTGQNQQDDPDFNGFSKATFILNPGKETNEVHLYFDKSTMLKSQDYMPFLLQPFDQLDSTHVYLNISIFNSGHTYGCIIVILHFANFSMNGYLVSEESKIAQIENSKSTKITENCGHLKCRCKGSICIWGGGGGVVYGPFPQAAIISHSGHDS
jgi:hypothetical protein